MKQTFKDSESVHIGYNVRRIREISGIKQYALADECGWSQQQMSRLENSKRISHDNLAIIAEKLGVSIEFIKNFQEERAIFNIQHGITVNENANNLNGYQPTYNNNHPIEPLIELFERFVKDDQKKVQSIEMIGRVVHDLAEEVKKLKAAGK
jgi:transcriptional regulator with XRE-family HTH domain